MAELLYLAARTGNSAEFLAKAALLLEAKAVFVAWTRTGTHGELEFLTWGMGEGEARAVLREIEHAKTVPALGVLGLKGGTVAVPLSGISSASFLNGYQGVLVLPLPTGVRVPSSGSRAGEDGRIRDGFEEGPPLPAGERQGDTPGPAFTWEAAPARTAWGLLCALGDYREDHLEGKEGLLDDLAACAALLTSSLDSRDGLPYQHNAW